MAGDARKKSEAAVSAKLADETYDLKSVQIFGREVLDDNTVVLTVGLEVEDELQTVKLVVKRIGNEWKFAGPQ